MQVYQSINAVQIALSKVGIAKDSKNQGQNFMFRGIDAVYNTLSPLLGQNNLCILPRMVSRVCEERVNGKGTALFYVTVEAEFDLVSSIDGSKHTIKTFGEAMDSGDKATNKAMSAAYKYACFQAFAIPTEGDNDADNHNHEVKSKHEVKPKQDPKQKPADLKIDQFAKADHIASIDGAANMEEAKKAFATAYSLAKAIDDYDAMEAFKSVYDQKKETLLAAGEEA